MNKATGYSGTGSAFCRCAEMILPWHIVMSLDNVNYSNLFKLWYLWSGRLEHDATTMSINEMKRRIAGLDAKYRLPVGVRAG
jgi:hypothetical protein